MQQPPVESPRQAACRSHRNSRNPEGFASSSPDGLFIGGNNFTANKAMSLLITCLLIGSLPPATDLRPPAVVEWDAIKAKAKEFQVLLDTH